AASGCDVPAGGAVTPTRYFCCDDRRRDAVAAHKTLNGIDFVEVVDDLTMPKDQRQRTIRVFFVKPLQQALHREQLRIEGGERIPVVDVTDVTPEADQRVLDVAVAQPGDFSFYTLRLVGDDENPPAGFDPILSRVSFSFKAECPSDF